MFSTFTRSCSLSGAKKRPLPPIAICPVSTQVSPVHTFSKAERLKSRKLIAELFKGGHSYLAYPFRVVWLPLPAAISSGASVQVAFTAPKRTFKTAVARNRIKRLCRESYRIHKSELYVKLQAENQQIGLLLMYVAKTELPFAEVVAGIKKALRKFPGEVPIK